MNQQFASIFLFFSLFSYHESLRVAPSHFRSSVVQSTNANSDVLHEPWWSQGSGGLHFKCTGCGRCCLNDGEVWMDAGEFTDVADFKNVSLIDLMNEYTEIVSGGWAKMKSYVSPITNEDKCIFLDKDNKQCTIYAVRPNQCRTYPWWPRLLLNESNWVEEACVPDDAKTGRKWSAKTGGCEGINHADAVANDPLIVSRNLELSSLYNNFGPTPSIMTQDEERSKFLQKTETMKAVIQCTKVWIKDFIVKYNLCPFAEKVLLSNTVRYRVFLGTDVEEIIEVIKFEMLHLMTSTEEDVSTTLIMLPFVFQEFIDFYDFSVELEDQIVPALERESRPAYTTKSSDISKKSQRRNSKLKKALSRQKQKDSLGISDNDDDADGNKEVEEIQIATFHPVFQFANTELNDPLNFEKRAPFPTINLLRASNK